MENGSREIFRLPYTSASASVFRNLGDPIKTIRQFVPWKCISREVLHLNWIVGEAQ
jgi:hypothetical protein